MNGWMSGRRFNRARYAAAWLFFAGSDLPELLHCPELHARNSGAFLLLRKDEQRPYPVFANVCHGVF